MTEQVKSEEERRIERIRKEINHLSNQILELEQIRKGMVKALEIIEGKPIERTS